jgi:cytochrome bd-type quinol oxidase subunit 2
MDPGLIFKGVVILLLIIIFFTLTGGMVFLIQDKGKSERTVKTLTVRIALSIALFVLLFVGLATGLIKPHGLMATHSVQTEKAPQ